MILNTYFNKKEKQSAAPAIQRIVLEPYRCVNLSSVSDTGEAKNSIVQKSGNSYKGNCSL